MATAQGLLVACVTLPSAAPAGLDEVLPAPALQLIRRARELQQPCFMFIDEACASSVHTLRWEALRLDGEALSEWTVVVRQAALDFGGAAVRFGSTACLNLFPRSEFDFYRRLTDVVERELMHFQPVSAPVPSAVPGEMIVFAHGCASGLQDTEGQAFVLDLRGCVPARVWLLACNLYRAMDNVARQLLERGVGTVVAAVGEIDTEETAQLVESWLGARDSGVMLEQWLNEARRKGPLSRAARSLVMWGRATCDAGPAADFNGRTWAALRDGDAPTIEENREEFDRGIAALDSRSLWPATCDWIVPQLLQLAETFDHKTMVRLREADIKETAVSSAAHLALADSAYRLGLYHECARELGRMARQPLDVDKQGELLACAVNVLIDMDLPRCAQRLADRHEDLSSRLDLPGVMVDAKRLDWRARISLREARFSAAQQSFARKATLIQSAALGHDNGRELAWMLYTRCWQSLVEPGALDGANVTAAEALARLARTDWRTAGRGKDVAPYLLRALALHAWLCREAALPADYGLWLAVARERLADVDPGPWAFTLCYLFLAGHADVKDADGAIDALANARYLFEAGALSALCGTHEEAQRYLSRYQQRREGVIAELAAFDDGPMQAELEKRLALETAIVHGNPAELASHGVFPM